MAIPSLFLVIARSALFIAIPSKRMPHSSLFLSLLHTPAPVSSFLSSTHTNRLPHSSLFLLLLQLNTLLLLPTPFSADFCPRALHASDSPLIAHPPFALHSVTSFPTPLFFFFFFFFCPFPLSLQAGVVSCSSTSSSSFSSSSSSTAESHCSVAT